MTAPQQDDASPAEPVLVSEQHGAVRVLRLNRPEARNALNSELIGALGAALVAAETDPDVRCVILTGTGDRAFCAGMDWNVIKEPDMPWTRYYDLPSGLLLDMEPYFKGIDSGSPCSRPSTAMPLASVLTC